LHDWDARFATGRINRGRDHEPDIVDMNQVRPLPAKLAKISIGVASPNYPLC
jgi:hypothetical protein